MRVKEIRLTQISFYICDFGWKGSRTKTKNGSQVVKARNPKAILLLEKLTIAGTSYQINQKLRQLSRCRAVVTDPTATIVVAVENGKVTGWRVGSLASQRGQPSQGIPTLLYKGGNIGVYLRWGGVDKVFNDKHGAIGFHKVLKGSRRLKEVQ